MKRRIHSIEEEKNLQESRYASLIDGLQLTINNLNNKIRAI